MIVYCCPKCRMVDIGDENSEKLCMRCSTPMLSLGLSSAEWNKLNDEEMKKAVNDLVGEEKKPIPLKQPEPERPPLPPMTYSESTSESDSIESESEDVIEYGKEDVSKMSAAHEAPKVRRVVKSVDNSDIDQKIQVDTTAEMTDTKDGKFTGLSIVAFVCSIIGCVGIVGIILGIVDLIQGSQTGDNRKKGLSIAAIVVGSFMILGMLPGILSTGLYRYEEKAGDTPALVETVEEPTTTVTPTPEPNEEPAEEETEEVQELEGNGVDANEWSEVAALEMSNETMLELFNDYDALIYSDEYPEDDVDAIDAYEENAANEIAEKYGITPDEARYVYSYVSMNYGKVANEGYDIDREPELQFGELKSLVMNGSTVIISAKIEPNIKNEFTIEENYINVDELIKDYNYGVFNEIQYFAFMDTVDGDETKVMSFTVPKDAIDGCANGQILGVMLADYVDELWITPQLQE